MGTTERHDPGPQGIRRRPGRVGLIVIALLMVTGLLAMAKPASAATFTVPDGDGAALKNAINEANGSAGPDTITLATDGTYTLTQVDNRFFGSNGLPAISSEITIEGNGAKIVRSGGQTPEFRLFYVSPSGNLTLRDVELVNGFARGGNGDGGYGTGGGGGGAAGMGGAIFNAGMLSVQGSTLHGNTAQGGIGGNFGSNTGGTVGGGGGGIAGNAFGGGNGGPGSYDSDFGCSAYAPGGACYPAGFPSSRSSGGHGGNGGPGGGGGGGYNVGEGGYGGFGGGGGGGGHQGGRGGHGGGYAPFHDGSPGVASDTGFGGGGGGGGNMNPNFSDSSGGPGMGGFGGGDGKDGAGGGAAGAGGAIFNHAGTVILTNTTVASNLARGGEGGTGVFNGNLVPGEDGVGLGGGLFTRNGAVAIQSSTFADNATSTPRPETVTLPQGMPGGSGGGIYYLADYVNDPPVPTLTMRDTIVANSAGIAPNGGSINDYQSHSRNSLIVQEGATNLIESGNHDGWFGATVTADPKLGPLQDNGGPTRTYALLGGSPAIDAAGSDCPATDGRGVARPQDGDGNASALCDIGAFEIGRPPNDDFANARTVSGNNASVRGFNMRATRESGEPDHYTSGPDAGWIGDHTVWYRWTAPAGGTATIDTCKANIDSILAVYTGEQQGTLTRVVDNNNACPNNPDGTTNWGSKVTFDARAGTTYQVAVGDAGGLRENTFTLKLALAPDAPPETTITSGPQEGTAVNSGSVSFGFTSTKANSTFECRLRSLKENAPGVSYSGCVSPREYTGLADGPYAFEVRATDRFDNTDATPASRTFTVDTTAPETALGPSGPSGTVNITSATFAFFSEVGTTFECKLDGGAFAPCASPKSYAGLANGSHAFSVRARDRAGNLDPSPAARAWTVDRIRPTVKSVQPTNRSGAGVALIRTNFRATFSEAMARATLNRATFKLYRCASATDRRCTARVTNVAVTPAADGRSATLNPFGASRTLLAKNTRYKVVLTGARDLAGNVLARQKVAFFRTGSR